MQGGSRGFVSHFMPKLLVWRVVCEWFPVRYQEADVHVLWSTGGACDPALPDSVRKRTSGCDVSAGYACR